jgi:hypothetical protein
MSSSPSVLTIYNHLNINLIELLQTLLRVIQYNAQPIPINELPSTNLLSFLPTLSLLNHSCSPNVILSHGSDKLNIFLSNYLTIFNLCFM